MSPAWLPLQKLKDRHVDRVWIALHGPGGEGWLVLSDLAEHLGLRSRATLMQWIEEAGLQVLSRIDTRPRHGKAQDASDPLHQARVAELTSLWRLGVACG